ncbi:hypothetical protein EDEG_02822 [Edhazardia aedis USNM 41457]|uniref:Autophagy-related protein 16 domain-containing protein n=1 Tax=Edhazardia aedis (strain USNM 41457) TaxID=1003232 RepID=J9DN36_EDHAE|nr:hypothetical protein EDEG_02822 [Edhazardia aedis USNM 41457]|eukprot:EJW02782.1 hypothetical protein EDEG_02822 [Edhazardia aedis USNM 41457]
MFPFLIYFHILCIRTSSESPRENNGILIQEKSVSGGLSNQLRKKIAKLKEKNINLLQKFEEKKKLIAQLHQENSDLEEIIADLEQIISDSYKKIAELKEKNINLLQKFEEEKKLTAQLYLENSDLEVIIAGLEQENSNKQLEISNKQQEIAYLNQEALFMLQEIEDLKILNKKQN